MGILKKDLAEKHKILKVIPAGSVIEAVSCPTGFDLIDYNTATICEGADGEEFISQGLPFGKIILLIGNSQGGKTTLAQQIAHAMAGDKNGDVIILDYERASNNVRLRYSKINGCSREEFDETVSVYNHVSMSTEFFKKIIFDIVEMKKKISKKDFIDWVDVYGKDIKIYPPTVLILDSIPAMKPDEVLTNAELDNNMVAGKMAAANSAVLKSIVNLLETYNITIIGLNHITTKIVTNKYAPRKVQLPGLGEDENLPGGNGWAFMPSYVFKLTSGAELKADKDFVEGRYTEVRLLKTRSGFNNKRMKFVLDARNGFSNAFTLMEYAKEKKILTGGGRAGYKFEGWDTGFSLKQFGKLYRTNEDFRDAFDNALSDYLGEEVTERYGEFDEEVLAAANGDFEDEFDDE